MEEMLTTTTQTKTNVEDLQEASLSYRQDLDYLKSKFNPQFVMKVDKIITTVQGFMYEVEVLKMNSQGYALKKDVEILEVKSQSLCPT